jgi:3-hydroxyisobutyrate dehydrogenase
MTGGIADALTLGKALNVTPEEIASLFDAWNPGVALPARLKKMTSDTFHQPTWELQMARKDAGLMIDGAKSGGEELVVVPAVAAVMDDLLAKGHAHDDWTVIGKKALP